MIKPEIKTVDDLKAEKARLKNQIKYGKASIATSFEEMKDELNPFKKAKDTAKEVFNSKLFTSKQKSPLVSYGISTATNFLLKKVLLRRAGFLPRLILPVVVKKATEMIAAPALNEKLVYAMRDVADTLREKDINEMMPSKESKVMVATAKLGNNISDKLHDVADKVRDDHEIKIPEKINSVITKTGNEVADNLREVADKIRNNNEIDVFNKKTISFKKTSVIKNDKVAKSLRELADKLRSQNKYTDLYPDYDESV